MPTDFIIGGRRFGKTTHTYEWLEPQLEQIVRVQGAILFLYPTGDMARDGARKFPFRHIRHEHRWIGDNSLRGIMFGLRTWLIIDNIEAMAEHHLAPILAGVRMFDCNALYTATPKPYNLDAKPLWVKEYEDADSRFTIPMPDMVLDEAIKHDMNISVEAEVAWLGLMFGYRITDVEVPKHLTYLKDRLIAELNKHDTHY